MTWCSVDARVIIDLKRPVASDLRRGNPPRHRDQARVGGHLTRFRGKVPTLRFGNAARRIRTCNQGIQEALAFPRGLDYLTLLDRLFIKSGARRPGARRRGLLLGLTPLGL